MKMDFTTIFAENFTVVVFVACLVIGYLIKHSFDFIPNKYIPAILAVLGSVLNAIVCGMSVNSVVYGALMGLASTGMHQVFKKFIESEKNDEITRE